MSLPRKRYVNLRAVLVLLVAGAGTGSGIYWLHELQMKSHIGALLDESLQAEQVGDIDKAQEDIELYLAVRKNDAVGWERYANIVDKRSVIGGGLERVFLVHEQAVRLNPKNDELRARAAELALKIGRPTEARIHLSRLFTTPGEANSRPVAQAWVAERLAACVEAEGGSSLAKYPSSTVGLGAPEGLPQRSAEDWYRTAIELDPGRASAYRGLAEWYFKQAVPEDDRMRGKPTKTQEGEAVLADLIAANPVDPTAYITRYRLARTYLPAADPADVQQALELAPENPEALELGADVLRSQGRVSEARRLLKQAEGLAPLESRYAQLRAQLELDEDGSVEAEFILRSAMDRLPATDLAVPTMLTELLISAGRIEGEGGARQSLSLLRARGLGRGYMLALEGQMAMRQGRWNEALKKLSAARSLLTTDFELSARITLLVAECYGLLKQPGDRLKVLKAAYDRPGLPLKLAYARALAETGQLDQALQEHLALGALRPESRVDAARLAIQKQVLRDPDQRSWLEVDTRVVDACKVLPEGGSESVLLRAESLAARGQREHARRMLELAWRQSPDETHLALGLAALLQQDQKPEEAISVLANSSSWASSQLELAEAQLGLTIEQGGNAVRPALEAALETAGYFSKRQQLAWLTTVGSAAWRVGEATLARRAWQLLVQLGITDAELLIELADMASTLADHELASQIREQIHPLDRQDGALTDLIEGIWLVAATERGEPVDFGRIETLALSLEASRPDWWGGVLLRAHLARIQAQPEMAIVHYQEVVRLGNTQSAVTHRLIDLLYRQNRYDKLAAMSLDLQKQGQDQEDLRLIWALGQIQQNTSQSIDAGLAAAHRVLGNASCRASDHVLYGRMLLSAGKWVEAEASLSQALKLAPSSSDGWITYLQILVNSGQRDKAREALESVVARQILEPFPLALAAMYAMVGNTDTADQFYTQAIGQRPNDPGVIQAIAAYRIEQGEVRPAEQLLARLLDSSTAAPVPIQAWARRSQALVRLRTEDHDRSDWKQSIAEIEFNLKANPVSFDDRSAHALLLAMKGSSRAQAITEFESLETISALSEAQQFLLAMLLEADGRSEASTRRMQRLLDGPVSDPRYLVFHLGQLLRSDRLEEADHWLQMLRRVDPKNPVAFRIEADLLKLRGRTADLRALLLGRTLESSELVVEAAEMLEAYGFVEEAEQGFRGWGRDQNRPLRQLPLAGFLARQDRTAEALEILGQVRDDVPIEQLAVVGLEVYAAPSATTVQKTAVESDLLSAIRQCPTLTILPCKLALIRIDQGRFGEAESLMRAALAGSPDNLEALNNLAWLLALREPPRISEAIDHIEHAIDLAGSQPGLLDTRGVVRLRAGDFAGAIRDLMDAKAEQTRNVSLSLHLAWARQGAGQRKEAREELARAREFGLSLERLDRLERVHVDRLFRDMDDPAP